MAELVEANVERLVERARREIDSGLLPSCQLALALDGDVVFDAALGDATPDRRYVIFSATKPIVASAAWLLIQRGELDPADKVTDRFEEFMADGEDERRHTITVEQVMLHTSGFPHAPLHPSTWSDPDARVAAMRRWRLNWEPGTAFEYHPTSAHWVLAELIRRITGEDHRDFVRREVIAPHGLDPLAVGVPRDEQDDVAELVATGEAPTPDELEAAVGIREMPVTEVTEEALLGFNDPAAREAGVPGGGGVATALALARFYQALLHNPAAVWEAELLADVTSKVRNTFPDPLWRVPAMRTLGLITAGDDGKASFRGFGKTGSPRRFGHNGAGGQLAFADPETGLSFAYLTNGLDAHPIRQARRGVALASIAAECAA